MKNKYNFKRIFIDKYPNFILCFIVLIHIFTLSKIVFFPYPELFVYPYLVERGLIPYKQIFDQHLPSFLLSPFNFYDLGLRNEATARIYLYLIVISAHFLIFLISRNLFENKKKLFIGNTFYLLTQPLFEGNYLWIDSFLTPILLLAFWFSLKLIEKNEARWALLTGICLGLSIYFKQTMFLLVIFLILFFYSTAKSLKVITILAISSLIPIATSLIWIYMIGVWEKFIYWVFSFNLGVYAKMGGKLPSFLQFIRIFIFWFISFFWLLSKRKKTFTLLAMFIFFSFLISLPRFEFLHLQPSLAFLVVCLFGIYDEKRTFGKVYLGLLLTVVTIWWSVFLRKNLLRESTIFTPEILLVSNIIKAETKETDPIFILGPQSIIYPLSYRLPAGRVFTVNVPWNMSVSEGVIYRSVLAEPPKLIVRDQTASIDGQKVVDFSTELNRFIEENYRLYRNIGNYEILKPK